MKNYKDSLIGMAHNKKMLNTMQKILLVVLCMCFFVSLTHNMTYFYIMTEIAFFILLINDIFIAFKGYGEKTVCENSLPILILANHRCVSTIFLILDVLFIAIFKINVPTNNIAEIIFVFAMTGMPFLLGIIVSKHFEKKLVT